MSYTGVTYYGGYFGLGTHLDNLQGIQRALLLCVTPQASETQAPLRGLHQPASSS